LDDLDKKSF